MTRQHHQATLAVTEFLDYDNEIVRSFTEKAIGAERNPVQQAIQLFYTIRDKIRYDVYGVDMTRKGLKASSIIESRAGFCIQKSIVFAAAVRSLGIPCKLVFSDVKNHISTPALKALVGGDIFHYHAYAVVQLEGKWVKATPVFNANLCRLFGIEPLEFDGVQDATLQPYDKDGKKCLEFIDYHGTFDDFPYVQCITELKRHHPQLFLNEGRTARGNLTREIRLANA